jgi:hypothetical protein
MHTKVKKLAHAAGHLSDAKKPNVMVKHFLDSAHGRHIASDDSETNIKSRFKHFAKSYDPAMHEEVELEEKRGLWDNIHAKRKRIKAGSGERMRKPGSEGAPTAAALKASNEEVEHENCGTPECCGQCDTAEVAEESGKSKQYIEITHVLGQKKRVPVHPLNAYKALNHYRNDPTTKSARIVSEEASNIIAKAKAAVAKKAGAKLKLDPDTGTPDHFTAAQRRKKGLEEAYGMWKVDFPKQHAGKAVAAGSVHVKAQNTAHAHKVAAKRVGVDHKMFKSKVTKSSILPEELGKSNEWGTDALRQKYAAATPGQEGLAAKKIPTFDARYDDVPTRYIGGIQKEETLSEISARGVIARQDFKAKLQKVLSDPKAIARAKKTIAKKKAAEADVPKNLVHQLHKSQSINAKVKFYDGKEHEIASNHHDKFMNKYHGLKSSIEKESLVNRAHKSHEEFLKAIHEEWADFSQEKPNTDSINPANYPTPPMHNDMLDYNSDDRHDEYDMVAIENDVTSEIENAEWADLVDYYDYEDLNYEDSDEDIAEGITPQGRLKKRFNMMRTKGRRNLARNMALKRVATPDRIKSRSVRAARNMVYSRVLRGRDRSSLSASEKTRLEGMVKRMAPMVGRLSIRLQQKERMIDRKRINNRNKRKKK